MSKYKEIFRLRDMLDKAKIKYSFNDRGKEFSRAGIDVEHYQICCPRNKMRYISVIERFWNLW